MNTVDEWHNIYGYSQPKRTAKSLLDPRGSGGTGPHTDRVGAEGDGGEPVNGNADSAGAPDVPGYGLTTDEFLRYQRLFTAWAADRIAGVGAQQYDRGGQQKFEDMSISELLTALREELADIINYAVMIDIQLNRWEGRRERLARG